MANTDGRRIWDIDPVSSVSGTEKVPIGKGGDAPAVVTINQLKNYIQQGCVRKLIINDGGTERTVTIPADGALTIGALSAVHSVDSIVVELSVNGIKTKCTLRPVTNTSSGIISAAQFLQILQGLDSKASKTELTETDSRVATLLQRLGSYTNRPSLTLAVDKDNMAIDATTGKPVVKTGWAISKPLTIVRGNEYLIKVGQTDGGVWCAAKRTVVPAWDEEVKDPETGEVIDIIHHPEEVYYSKKVQLNADAELPEDGYLRVLGMPQDFDMVVSYHKATADTTVIVLRDGLTANICTQVGEVDTAAEESLDANMQNVTENIGNVGAVVDTLEYRIGQYPQTLFGHGTPSASIRPINLGNDKHTGFPLPWLGTPEFVGQMYIDIDVNNGGLYYAIPTLDDYGNITSLKWGNANS